MGKHKRRYGHVVEPAIVHLLLNNRTVKEANDRFRDSYSTDSGGRGSDSTGLYPMEHEGSVVETSTSESTAYFRSSDGENWSLCYDNEVREALESGVQVKHLTITHTTRIEYLRGPDGRN